MPVSEPVMVFTPGLRRNNRGSTKELSWSVVAKRPSAVPGAQVVNPNAVRYRHAHGRRARAGHGARNDDGHWSRRGCRGLSRVRFQGSLAAEWPGLGYGTRLLGRSYRQAETVDLSRHHPFREIWAELLRNDRRRKSLLVK